MVASYLLEFPHIQVPDFSYMCGIRDTMFPAMRNSESSLTCQIERGQIGTGLVGIVQIELLEVW